MNVESISCTCEVSLADQLSRHSPAEDSSRRRQPSAYQDVRPDVEQSEPSDEIRSTAEEHRHVGIQRGEELHVLRRRRSLCENLGYEVRHPLMLPSLMR